MQHQRRRRLFSSAPSQAGSLALRACSIADAMISSVVSLSVARADPSASSGMSPRVSSACLAGPSPEQVQVSMSVLRRGTATVSTGIGGRYLRRQKIRLGLQKGDKVVNE